MTTNDSKTIFFLGKGGTGKSTASALTALELAAKGSKVLLASFDDAHNLSDIFQTAFTHRATRLADNLDVLQVDRDLEIKRYLEHTTQKVKQSYNYLTAFNMHNYFDVLKFSPGMEAHALATAFTQLKKKNPDLDYLIIDMPPTALSMHFFNLPALSLLWIEQLEKLRNEINERKEIISRIQVGSKEIQRDKVLARIKALKSDHLSLKNFFGDSKKALFVAVHNGEPLSRAETQRIISQLDALDINLTGLILNHRTPPRPQPALPSDLSAVNSLELPYSADPLIGIETLKQYAQKEQIALSRLIS